MKGPRVGSSNTRTLEQKAANGYTNLANAVKMGTAPLATRLSLTCIVALCHQISASLCLVVTGYPESANS